jgi:peptide/nickel transport system substrate-binding protein
MSDDEENPNVSLLKRELADRRINRREFVRYSVLVGMAAPAAYAYAGASYTAAAAQNVSKGGTLRMGTRVKALDNPATYAWGTYDSNITRQVCEYLTVTDRNNITHPSLLESWQASPDLKTWTLRVRGISRPTTLCGI